MHACISANVEELCKQKATCIWKACAAVLILLLVMLFSSLTFLLSCYRHTILDWKTKLLQYLLIIFLRRIDTYSLITKYTSCLLALEVFLKPNHSSQRTYYRSFSRSHWCQKRKVRMMKVYTASSAEG